MIFCGGPEAVGLWLMERKKRLHGCTQVAGALLLWLCFPLAFWLIATQGTSCPDGSTPVPEEQEAMLLQVLYLLFGSHLLWFMLVGLVQMFVSKRSCS